MSPQKHDQGFKKRQRALLEAKKLEETKRTKNKRTPRPHDDDQQEHRHD